MEEKSLRPRERQVVELLLQGCDNDEISRQLHMARRTVKAHFNRLFVRFGITGGVKRVKLATLLYRRQLCSETTEAVPPTTESNESLSSSLSVVGGTASVVSEHSCLLYKSVASFTRLTPPVIPNRTNSRLK